MNYENLIVEIQNNIATITINRPTKLNALNKITIYELHHAFNLLSLDFDVKIKFTFL